MITKIGFTLAAIATMSLAACSGSSKQDAANVTSSTVQTDGLMGTYTSTCTNIPGAVLGLSSYNVKYDITGHIEKYTTYYSSNDCQNEVLDIHTTAQYDVPAGGDANSTALPEKTAAINIDWKHEVVTPKTQALVDAMNVANYCGINNWSLTGTDATPAERNVDTDSGSATCFGTDKLATVFDLINTQNHQLHFGQSVPLLHDKSSDAQRPVVMDSTVVGTN